MLVLDTNVVSELRKQASGRCDASVSRWAESIDLSTTYLSVISVLEIELGILQIERRDIHQAQILKAWFEQLLLLYDKRLISVDQHVARRAAALHVPDPRPERDSIIAASALVHGFSLATRNIRDFETTELKLVDPWDNADQ